MNPKVLLIGLDGAPWALLNQWISSNQLPTLKKIAKSGIMGPLKSTIPSITFPAVPSLLTGMNPGNFGIFSFIKPDGLPVTLWDLKYDKIWNVLDNNNLKSCIVNIPLSYPPEKINDVMISGWTPSDDSIYVHPKNMQNIVGKFHDSKIQKEIFKLRYKKHNKNDRIKLISNLIELIERRYRVFKILNQMDNYDLSLLWIYQTDVLQHCCWEYKETLLELYIKIDNILSDILTTFSNRNLFIVSDHGFESNPSRFFFANTWLYNHGYLKQNKSPLKYILNSLQVFSYNNLPKNFISKILTTWQSLRNKNNSEQNISVERFNNIPGLDVKNSKAYLSTLFGININCDNNYQALRNEIIKKLKNIKDENNNFVIRDIWKKEDVYKGKYLRYIPDIIFLTSEKYVPFPALSKKVFSKINRRAYWWQSGEHYRAMNGILLASGPDIKKKSEQINANIEDIFPTILHILGYPIPSYVDGKIITDIYMFDREPVFSHEYEKGDQIPEKISGLEKKDEEKILERLKKLGYIE
ncbi:MAG: alkaline phosphatase family protein [Candidatus Hodarchaeota archaeon]